MDRPRTSISRIETFASCARYDYYQVVERIQTPPSPHQEAGNLIHSIVESQFSASPQPLLGAAAQVMRYYPLPGQDGIEIERKFEGVPYAGALLYAKIDCYVPPWGLSFGGLIRPPKQGLARIIDLKTTASRSVRYKQDATLLDTNRQLLAYVRIRRPEDEHIEVAQVVVGRDAPHTHCGPVRIIDQQQAIEQEGYDSEVVARMVESRKAPSALDLAPAPVARCENWYGKRCDFYDRCHGSASVAVRSWSDILTSADQDGRGGEGTRSALDLAVENLNKEKERQMINPTDANTAHTSAALVVEGETHMRAEVLQGKPYCSIVGTRHGQPWELRALLDDWKFLTGGEIYDFSLPTGRTVKRVRDGILRSYGTAVLSVGSKQDVDLIRHNVLHPQLRAWDAEVNPAPVPTPTPAPAATPAASALEEIAAAAQDTAPSGGDVGEIAKLEAGGCTPSQASKMVAAGITDARLRAGSVTLEELSALYKFGPARAEAILSRYKAAATPAAAPAATPAAAPAATPAAAPAATPAAAPATTPAPFFDMLAGSPGHPLPFQTDVPAPTPTASETSGLYDLYIDCIPVQGRQYAPLEEILRPHLDAIAVDRGVPDVLCLKAFEWPGLLMQSIHQNPPQARTAITVRSSTKEWDVVHRFFLGRARVVVQGI